MKIKAIRAIERHQMLHPGDTVLVALSGGADSMALLKVLYELKNEVDKIVLGQHFIYDENTENIKMFSSPLEILILSTFIFSPSFNSFLSF